MEGTTPTLFGVGQSDVKENFFLKQKGDVRSNHLLIWIISIVT